MYRILATTFFALFLLTNRVAAQDVKQYGQVEYTQEVVRTEVPYDIGFFSKNIQMIDIVGFVWTPIKKKFEKPPVVVFNHGSQDGGTTLSIDPARISKFLERGYAVVATFRKGFSPRGDFASSRASANSSEPISCGVWSSSESGVHSAIDDVTAIMKAVAEKRPDIDYSKKILTGSSRGGFLSVALAAEGMNGVQLILNFSGGWYSERCYAGFNSKKFNNFSEQISKQTEPPIVVSFYGGRDSYYSVSHIRQNLDQLKKIPRSSEYILEDGTHTLVRDVDHWWPIVEKQLDEIEMRWKK